MSALRADIAEWEFRFAKLLVGPAAVGVKRDRTDDGLVMLLRPTGKPLNFVKYLTSRYADRTLASADYDAQRLGVGYSSRVREARVLAL